VLPTHGTVTSVFHLANSLRHSTYPDVAEWVRAAGARSSFLSAALDHRPVANFLIAARLVAREPVVKQSRQLAALSRQADRSTLVAIARLLLEHAPPQWLLAAVDGQVHEELIPWADLQGLAWLRPELNQILVDTAVELNEHTDSIALGLGRAAELAIFSALDAINASPVHVSEISDRFGYDIEALTGPATRWEVKGSTTNTSDSFHLSRNEFEKSQRFCEEWRLVQVEFEPSVLTSDFVAVSHISIVRELRSDVLKEVAPLETGAFRWETSALITPPAGSWSVSSLKVPDDFRIPGIGALGKQAIELRSR
jgi:hypothetical protein